MFWQGTWHAVPHLSYLKLAFCTLTRSFSVQIHAYHCYFSVFQLSCHHLGASRVWMYSHYFPLASYILFPCKYRVFRVSQTSGVRKTSTNLLESFNPKASTVDAFFEEAPMLKNPLFGEVELKFIHQVFYGCYRYSKLLKLLSPALSTKLQLLL